MRPIYYRGWYLVAFRIGARGEYTGDARDGLNVRDDIGCSRYGGKGAKLRVIDMLKKLVDKVEENT